MRTQIQGGQDSLDALSWRSLSTHPPTKYRANLQKETCKDLSETVLCRTGLFPHISPRNIVPIIEKWLYCKPVKSVGLITSVGLICKKRLIGCRVLQGRVVVLQNCPAKHGILGSEETGKESLNAVFCRAHQPYKTQHPMVLSNSVFCRVALYFSRIAYSISAYQV